MPKGVAAVAPRPGEGLMVQTMAAPVRGTTNFIGAFRLLKVARRQGAEDMLRLLPRSTV
jgi:hypothetical protein